MNLAQEYSATLEEQLKTIQRKYKEERAYYGERSEIVLANTILKNERDQMQAEEFISRYSAMEYDV